MEQNNGRISVISKAWIDAKSQEVKKGKNSDDEDRAISGLSAYDIERRKFVKFLGDRGISEIKDINEDVLNEYAVSEVFLNSTRGERQHRPADSLRRGGNVVRSIFKFAFENGYIDHIPVFDKIYRDGGREVVVRVKKEKAPKVEVEGIKKIEVRKEAEENNVVPVEKKHRGRPRKEVVVDPIAPVVAVEKKHRGRPRKDGGVAVELPVDGILPEKKHRGRHRKEVVVDGPDDVDVIIDEIDEEARLAAEQDIMAEEVVVVDVGSVEDDDLVDLVDLGDEYDEYALAVEIENAGFSEWAFLYADQHGVNVYEVARRRGIDIEIPDDEDEDDEDIDNDDFDNFDNDGGDDDEPEPWHRNDTFESIRGGSVGIAPKIRRNDDDE